MENQDTNTLTNLILLFGKQTPEERETLESMLRNGVGFNRWDARQLTLITKAGMRNGGLTDRQRACVAKKLPKYHKQIGTIRAQIKQVQLFPEPQA